MKKLLSALFVLSMSISLVACDGVTNTDVGTVSGGVIGGLIGSRFGGGSGRVAAATGGAIVGAMIGNSIGVYTSFTQAYKAVEEEARADARSKWGDRSVWLDLDREEAENLFLRRDFVDVYEVEVEDGEEERKYCYSIQIYTLNDGMTPLSH